MTFCNMCKAIKCTRKIWKIFWLCIKPTQVIIDDLHLASIKDTLFVNIFRLNILLLKNKRIYGCWDRGSCLNDVQFFGVVLGNTKMDEQNWNVSAEVNSLLYRLGSMVSGISH